ncbi:hypothetical protein FPV67DRAFT_1426747 [Lyophyllum atratum]|nr:hypothetical protein FPV67DRAFT_1426747 [Lyophyllum atratum]
MATQAVAPLQFLSAYSQLADAEKAQVDLLIAAATSQKSASSTTAALFSEEGEKPATATSTSREVAFHPCLLTLASHKQHIPLPLFLTSSLRRLNLDYNNIETKNIRLENNAKLTVIKTNSFPDEASMEPADWMEAWRNRLKFMKVVGASTGVYERWNRHFVFLSGHENLKANFQSILMFDIEQRKEYAAHPTAFQEGLYHARFQEIKAENLEAKFTALKSSLAVRTTIPNNRHEPYPSGSSGSRSEPFSRGSGGSASSPICLICGRTGHKFPACKTTTTVMGKAVVVKLVGRRFESIASAVVVCISWNIGGNSRCSADHPDEHTCSICGAKLHHANSKSCVT